MARTDPDDLDDRPEDDEPLTACWRCGKFVVPRGRCPFCRAKLAGRGYAVAPPETPRATSPLLAILGVFGAILATNAIGIFAASQALPGPPTADPFGQALPLLTVLTVLGAGLVFWAWAAYRRECRLPAPDAVGLRAAATLGAAPLLAAALGLNLLYHRALRDFVGLPATPDLPGWERHYLMAILLICVAPAWVEELFFRQLVLGSLRRHMGPHAAVAVSALMFGLAHLGAPLSVPYLTLLGVVLGYLRLGSGTLVVPIVFHGVHNYVVLVLDGG